MDASSHFLELVEELPLRLIFLGPTLTGRPRRRRGRRRRRRPRRLVQPPGRHGLHGDRRDERRRQLCGPVLQRPRQRGRLGHRHVHRRGRQLPAIPARQRRPRPTRRRSPRASTAAVPERQRSASGRVRECFPPATGPRRSAMPVLPERAELALVAPAPQPRGRCARPFLPRRLLLARDRLPLPVVKYPPQDERDCARRERRGGLSFECRRRRCRGGSHTAGRMAAAARAGSRDPRRRLRPVRRRAAKEGRPSHRRRGSYGRGTVPRLLRRGSRPSLLEPLGRGQAVVHQRIQCFFGVSVGQQPFPLEDSRFHRPRLELSAEPPPMLLSGDHDRRGAHREARLQVADDRLHEFVEHVVNLDRVVRRRRGFDEGGPTHHRFPSRISRGITAR